MKKLLQNSNFRAWLALAGSISIVMVTAYTMVQQSTRLTANDLPLSTAQSIKNSLDHGSTPTDVVPSAKVDLRADTNVFTTIIDNSYHVLASSAQLDNKNPLPPTGVFEYSKAHGIDKVTFQPDAGVRLAIVVMPYGQGPDGYIMAGQSLKPAEDRVSTYNVLLIAGWIVAVAWASIWLLPNSKK